MGNVACEGLVLFFLLFYMESLPEPYDGLNKVRRAGGFALCINVFL